MKIALCHEAVLPSRGGCETYVAHLARRLVRDGHDVHLYARQRDESALPAALHFHPVHLPPCFETADLYRSIHGCCLFSHWVQGHPCSGSAQVRLSGHCQSDWDQTNP